VSLRAAIEATNTDVERKGSKMAQYFIVYFGDKRPKDGAAHMARWRAWMGGLGTALVNPGAPFSAVKVIDGNGVSDSTGAARVNGYSIVEAGSLDAAVEMAKGCPHLDIGTIEVAEVMDMKMM
jgi:hypothetical protein